MERLHSCLIESKIQAMERRIHVGYHERETEREGGRDREMDIKRE